MSVFHNNILAGASGAGGAAAAFQIDRSLRFNSGDSAHLSRTPVNAGNRKTWTWSCWIKKTADAGSPDDALFTAGTAGATQNRFIIKFSTGDQSLEIGQDVSGSFTSFRKTSQVFRDYSSWGHLVVAFDSTDSTADDRLKIYWNGSQITDFAIKNTITQNLDTFVNNTGAHNICADVGNYHGNLNTYLAEVHFVDGQQLAATDFGEYDANNVWQPKQYSGDYNYSTGTVYSASSSGMSSPGLMFDGDTSTSPSLTADGTVYTMLTGVSIPCSSSLRINANANNFQVSVNGGSYTSATSVNSTYLSLSVPSGNTLTSLTFKDGAGGGYGVRALEVDGTVLVDGSVGVNGFHLNFSDNSTVASLGDDQREGATDYPTGTTYGTIEGGSVSDVFDGNLNTELSIRPNGSGVTLDTSVVASSSVRIYGSSEGTASARYQINGSNTSAVPTTFPTRGWTAITGLSFPITINSFGIGGGSSTNGARLNAIEIDGNILTGTINDWTATNFSIGSTAGIYAIFSGSSNQYLRYGASGVLSQNSSFTIECHFYPHTSNVIGLFDGGAGQTSIIRNYDNNKIEKQGDNSVDFAGDYTVNAWNHIAAVYNGSTDTMTVYVNGASSGTASFNSFTGGNNFDIGTINGGGDGRFDGFIRNFRVTKSVVYSAAFTAPSVDSNLSALANTSLLVLTTTANGLTTDASGSSRNMTNNGSVTSGTTGGPHVNDSLIDTPTNYEANSGNNGGNYCTLNPIDDRDGATYTDGNLQVNGAGGNYHYVGRASFGVSSGKFYWEATINSSINETYYPSPGIASMDENVPNQLGDGAGGHAYMANGQKYTSATLSSYGASFTQGDIIGFALDMDAGTLTAYKNGTSQGTMVTGLTGTWGPSWSHYQSTSLIYNFGQRSFEISSVPTGYKSLCTQNLDNPTIADGSTAMDVKTYSGTGSTQSITGLAFSPDLVWIKNRSVNDTHAILDTTRGTNTVLSSNLTNGDRTESGSVTAFNSDGFTVGGYNDTNRNNSNFVAWTWDAGSSAASNTDGSITSSVRASQTNGFSIVSYTGNSTVGSTIGHGLNAQPGLVIIKNRDRSINWVVGHLEVDSFKTGRIYLNTSGGQGTDEDFFNNTNPTSSVFTVKDNYEVNYANEDYIAYCFAPVEGYSKFGSYVGDGASPNFVHVGFRPAFLIVKSTTANDWVIYDSTRNPYNLISDGIFSNYSYAEVDNASNYGIDLLSNGFALRTTGGYFTNSNNASEGHTYLYIAFAEHPFKTARAR